MNDIGIDISKHTSKSIEDLDDEFINNLDYVITLCAEEVCPVLPTNANILHWVNEDPASPKLTKMESTVLFQKTRDDTYNLLKKLMLDNL